MKQTSTAGMTGRRAADSVVPLASGVDVPGTPGDDTIAGDVLRRDARAVRRTADAGNGNGSVDGADGEDVARFGDTLFGIGGNDVLAGDVVATGRGRIELAVLVGNSDGPGGRGGDNNRLAAFADRVGGGAGADRVAGDAFAVGGEVDLSISLGQAAGEAVGGDVNRASAFNDTLFGDDGDDTIAGDVLARGTDSVRLSVQVGRGADSSSSDSYAVSQGGDYGLVQAFGDRLDGGNGRDVLAGDVHRSGGDGTIELNVEVGPNGIYSRLNPGDGSGGVANVAFAHEDRLFGRAGNDILAGDVFSSRGPGAIMLSVGAGVDFNDYGGRTEGRNIAHAFEDLLRGGAGADRLAGEVYLLQGSAEVSIDLLAGTCGIAGIGRNSNAAIAGNDDLDGGGGNDIVAGDVLRDRSSGPVSLAALSGTAEGRTTDYFGLGGNANMVEGFGDRLTGGGGADLLIGDVHGVDASGELLLRAASGTGNYAQAGGRHNLTQAFNDSLAGGDDADTLIGDVAVTGSSSASDSVELTADAGSGGAYTRFDGVRLGGGFGGDGNETGAFNDSLSVGAGSDVLVGDVQATGLAGALLFSATAGLGPDSSRYGRGAGGTANTTRAFNDQFFRYSTRAGSAVGDLDVLGGTGAVALIAAAGCGGNPSSTSDGTDGGDDNTVEAFCDGMPLYPITGGLFVGDIRSQDFGGTIDLTIQAGLDGVGNGESIDNGGHGNSVTAFNDLIFAHWDATEGVVLVGDIYAEGVAPSLTIRIEGEADNGISAFRDQLFGSGRADTLWGDFFGLQPIITIDGDFDGRDGLFGDFLDGGWGNDLLSGQLGNDRLIGGEGADTMSGGVGGDSFEFSWLDLFSSWDLLPSGATAVPVDTINDFAAGDVLDLSSLILGRGPVESFLSLREEGGDTIFAFDRDGSGTAADFADFVRLESFTTTLSVQQLIDGGVILIP